MQQKNVFFADTFIAGGSADLKIPLFGRPCGPILCTKQYFIIRVLPFPTLFALLYHAPCISFRDLCHWFHLRETVDGLTKECINRRKWRWIRNIDLSVRMMDGHWSIHSMDEIILLIFSGWFTAFVHPFFIPEGHIYEKSFIYMN